MALSASAASADRGPRVEKVRRIFERFDTNRDGGLDRNEMAALVVGVNPRVKFTEDQISAILDEVIRTYAEFILPDGRGLSLPGLLRTYDDGAGDVDRDFLALSLPAVYSDTSSPEIAASHSSPPSGLSQAAAVSRDPCAQTARLANDKDALLVGVNTMLKMGMKLLGKRTLQEDQCPLLGDQKDNQDEEED